jgi:hypothetical protein
MGTKKNVLFPPKRLGQQPVLRLNGNQSPVYKIKLYVDIEEVTS